MAGTSGFSVRNLLVVGEMALALVLLTAGGLLVKSVVRLQAHRAGLLRRRRSSRSAWCCPRRRTIRVRGSRFIIDLIDRLASRRDTGTVAFGSCAPLSGGCNHTLAKVPGGPTPEYWRKMPVGVLWASPAYFETLGIRLLRGRLLTGQDRAGQPKVVLVNETAARTYWPGDDPLGKRIALGQGGFEDGAEVIGMVADVRYGAVETSVGPDVYLPLLQAPRALGFLFVRTTAAPATIVPQIRAAVEALDPNLPLIDVKTMEMRFGEATWRQRSSAWLLGIFAMLALALSATGIYAVMSQSVEQRRREIGVRLALGAARRDILQLVIGRVTAIAAAGIGTGLVLAVTTMPLLSTLLYHVTPGGSVRCSLCWRCCCSGVTLAAGYIPARRATRVDPMITLRAE